VTVEEWKERQRPVRGRVIRKERAVPWSSEVAWTNLGVQSLSDLSWWRTEPWSLQGDGQLTVERGVISESASHYDGGVMTAKTASLQLKLAALALAASQMNSFNRCLWRVGAASKLLSLLIGWRPGFQFRHPRTSVKGSFGAQTLHFFGGDNARAVLGFTDVASSDMLKCMQRDQVYRVALRCWRDRPFNPMELNAKSELCLRRWMLLIINREFL
jgi:hypothetical protein